MKKVLSVIFLLLGAFCVYGQDLDDFANNAITQNYNTDYNIKFILKESASVIISEKFVINSDRERFLPPFKRVIKTENKLENISLYLNGRYVLMTEIKQNIDTVSITINDILWLKPGKNTVMLTYEVPSAIYAISKKDHFKWDLDLQNLPYQPQKGTLVFKTDATLNKGQIVFKHLDAEVPFDIKPNFIFPITTAFQKELKVSLNLSFEQGFFKSVPAKTHLLKTGASALVKGSYIISPILIMLVMVIYCYILWNKYGKDPKGPFVTEYNPPAGITPAFAKFLLNRKRSLNFSYFIITLIHLSLNKYIEITSYRGEVCIKSLRGADSSGLVEEDKIIYDSLFAYSPQIILNKANSSYVSSAIQACFLRIIAKGEDYFTPNYFYMALPIVLLLFSFIVLVASTNSPTLLLAAFCFLICLVTFVLFVRFIDNVSPRYRKIYCKLMGFKQYMQIAEEGRVHFSDPLDEQRLFCDYLAYAYAFGMEERIIRKIRYKFDSDVIFKYLNEYVSISTLTQDYLLDTLHLLLSDTETTRARRRKNTFNGIKY